ncbi:spry domain protein [uncultured Mediterranean phage uvMED]|nr:spry domain protein [uncultured Mediterranean phage uvMED]
MFSNELWNKSGVSTYSIDQSIRFNQSDSAYLTKTFGGSASNRRTHTYSFWLKLGANAAGTNASGGCFFLSTNDSGASAGDYLHLNGDLKLRYWSNESSASTFETNQLFRDFSAWYHITLVNDRDNAVGSEAVRLYVNGQRVTSFAVNNISARKSQDTMVNASSFLWMIQRFTSSTVHGDGYMAEIVFLDGTATDCNSFGEFNDSGIWIPKDVSGLTFGTNGFYIDGRDASDLGDDESGQGNDFTTSGLAAHDQVADSPTNNFAIANPLDSSYYMGSETFSEGNLQMTLGSSVGGLASMGITSGKWYAEFEVHSGSTTYFILGIYGDQPTSTQHYVGQSANSYGYYANTGQSYNNASASSYGNSYTVSDVIGVAVDLDNNKLYFSKNGTFQNSGDPTSGATGTGAISINPVSSTGLGAYFIASSSASSTPSSHTINYNFGQDGTFAGNVTAGGNSDGNGVGNFKYSVPSGYLALCTKNLGS